MAQPMTQDGKAAQLLLQQFQQLQRQMEALGIVADAETGTIRNKLKKAADGGPLSSIHTRLPKHRLKTVKVLREVNGEQVETIISERDFDKRIHTKVEEVAGSGPRRNPLAGDPTPAPEPAPAFGTQDANQLSKMSMEKLSKMPEVEHMDEVPTTKGELVEAILDVRRTFAEDED